MKKIIHFIGIDVSKNTFDLALIKNNDPGQIMQKLFSNNITGFKNLTVWMKQQMICYEDTVFVLSIPAIIVSLLGNLSRLEKEIYGWKCH